MMPLEACMDPSGITPTPPGGWATIAQRIAKAERERLERVAAAQRAASMLETFDALESWARAVGRDAPALERELEPGEAAIVRRAVDVLGELASLSAADREIVSGELRAMWDAFVVDGDAPATVEIPEAIELLEAA